MTTVEQRAVRSWAAIPKQIRRSIAGLSKRDLDLRVSSEAWSIRETVHHLVEANLIASNIVLAALGQPDCRYDWSWVMPNTGWLKRLGYDKAPVEPALDLLEALSKHIATVLRRAPSSLQRTVRLLDKPGARLRRRTVKQVLAEECGHAQHHLGEVIATRKAHGRVTPRKAG